MNKLKWVRISPTLSDETVTFRVDGVDGMTVHKFIQAVIEQEHSQFLSFHITGNGQFMGVNIDIGNTKILTPEQEKKAELALKSIVESVTCNGGWGQMGYTIKVKTTETMSERIKVGGISMIKTEDGHFIDDPMDVVNAKPDFEGLGMTTSEEIERLSAELQETKIKLGELAKVVFGLIDILNADYLHRIEMLNEQLKEL